jgi:hypothetical protein
MATLTNIGQLHARLAGRGAINLTWLVVLRAAANAPGAAIKIAANFMAASRCAWPNE